ncbi:DDE-type integrase/transposase/recombinase [Providencia rettgeri]|uniref:DDE-type integrase/transposase/recombinase n=1 Tax=Providencia rettgeri TaxID=587 RepID=UPI003D161D8F
MQHYAPQFGKSIRYYWHNSTAALTWYLDETYIITNEEWAYLYYAVDSKRDTLNFYLLT